MTEGRIAEIQTNPHAAQLEKGFRWLRFEPGLELEFMRDYWTNHRLRVRSGMIIGAIIFAAFTVKDIITLPTEAWIWTVITVDGFIVPVMLTGAALTLVEDYKPWITRASHVVLVLVWIGFVVSMLETVALGTPTRYESIMLTIAYILFSTGLRAVPALTSCIFGVVVYLVGIRYLGVAPEEIQAQTFHLVSITAIGAIGAYAREAMLRKLFLTQSLSTFRAEHDPLTQLLNRGAAMRRIEIAWRQAARQDERISIFLIDADHFKAYNDRYGHVEGDKCLIGVSKAIKEPLNRPMDVAARYGGEEFVALAYGADQKDAAAIADRIRVNIENMRLPLESGGDARITVSIGIASIRPASGPSGSEITDVLRLADAALYSAKSSGRNRAVLSQTNSF